MTGVTFVPGVTHLTYGLTGLGPTLWRVSWGCTVGALVGVAAAWAAVRLRPRRAALTGLVVAASLAGSGDPIWAEETNTGFQAPLHWQRGDATRAVVARVLAESEPGDLVLAPSGLSITLVVTNTDVRAVAPRDYAMHPLRNVPSFHYADRLVLYDFVNHVGDWRLPAVTRALRVLGVDTVCLYGEDVVRAEAVQALGYRPSVTTPSYRCFHR
jgi:hypothetical protein